MSIRMGVGHHLVAVSAVLSAACGTPIFSADFNEDTVNRAPNTSPPSDPVGDELILPPAPPPLGTPRAQVAAPAHGFTSNSLRYTSVNLLAPLGPLSFVAVSVAPTSRRYTATWMALRQSNGAPATLNFDFQNGSGVTLAHVDNNAGQYNATSAGGRRAFIGTVPNDSLHQVAIILDAANGTYSVVLLTPEGSSLGSVTGLPLLSRAAMTRPTLRLSYSSLGGASYFLDDVLITEECPDDTGELGACD